MHTARVILLSILAVGAAAACYQPPRIPRNKPLTCSSADPAECPTGFVCIANVSAPAMALPEGATLLLASGPLDDAGRLPPDTAVWLAVRGA